MDFEMKCPKCGAEAMANFVDNGVGMQQIEPYYCEACDWVEGGCPQDVCNPIRCISYGFCQGRSIRG
jgi:hypothetical protein